MHGGEIYAGVRALDHTADVGFDASAAGLPELFHRAAMGMMELIRGADREESEADDSEPRAPYATGEWRRIQLEADDVASLLVAWLRELLWLHEARRFVYRGARFETLDEHSLLARVGGAADDVRPVREIKGVTYHGLRVERAPGGEWHARVIFDV